MRRPVTAYPRQSVSVQRDYHLVLHNSQLARLYVHYRLLAQGFPRWEIVHAIRAARITRTNRKQSNDSRAIAEAVEEASRKLKRLMSGSKQSHSSGPCPLKLGPTNADLKGHSNPSSGALPVNCDRTVTDESSVSTFLPDFPRAPTNRQITKKPSYDSLPKLPTRVSLKEDSDSSDSDELAHSYRTTTTLREALALNPRHDRSVSHEAPKLPERRISGHDKEDEILSEACRLVEALDAVAVAMEQQQAESSASLPTRDSAHDRDVPPVPLRRHPSSEEDEEIEVGNKESTFWHSYPTEQAPQVPLRAKLRAKSPVAA